jgi:hypothetical protein
MDGLDRDAVLAAMQEAAPEVIGIWSFCEITDAAAAAANVGQEVPGRACWG